MMKFKIRLFIPLFIVILFLIIVGIFSNANGGREMNLLEGTIVFTTGGITSEGGDINIADIKNIAGTVKNIFKERVFVFETTWSPDGSRILFVKDNMTDPLLKIPRYEIMITDREGKDYKKVLDMGKTPCGYPSLSPDGTKIAFLAGEYLDESWGELYIAAIDGTNIKKVSNLKTFSCRPAWLTDGKRIVFTSIDKKIYSINYDGTDLKEIAKCIQPALSPDGKKLAFRGPWNIYLCDINGKNKKLLVWNYNRAIFGDYIYPSNLTWSPDGQYLLYARKSWGIWGGIFADMMVVSTANPFKKIQLNYAPGGQLRAISWAKK